MSYRDRKSFLESYENGNAQISEKYRHTLGDANSLFAAPEGDAPRDSEVDPPLCHARRLELFEAVLCSILGSDD
jgi:hypothetical protein